jgi:hypothetical protein
LAPWSAAIRPRSSDARSMAAMPSWVANTRSNQRRVRRPGEVRLPGAHIGGQLGLERGVRWR